MIYKFHFNVCNDDNKLVSHIGEESGSFWWAFTDFMKKIMKYAQVAKLDQRDAT